MSRGHYSLTTPCKNCPFRTDVRPFITPGRVRDIERSLVRSEFPCHKTTRPDDDAEDDSVYIPKGGEIHCAGALILLEKLGRPSQMMRIAERLRGEGGAPMYDASKLDMEAPVYDSFTEMYRAHVAEERKDKDESKRKAASTAAASCGSTPGSAGSDRGRNSAKARRPRARGGRND